MGEDAAGDWYLQHGCQIVQRNWSFRTGEIDLICRRGRVLVIRGVKTRHGAVRLSVRGGLLRKTSSSQPYCHSLPPGGGPELYRRAS
ncbi:MAG: YraN family protein [Acidimicrobiales bacterium]